MRLRIVGHKHYILGERFYIKGIMRQNVAPKQLTSRSARKFWHNYLDYTDLKQAHAVIITHERQIIAFFRYILHNAKLTALGTWVAPKYRRLGLAARMWAYVLTRANVKEIDVYTASRGGEKLVKKIVSLYPDIVWMDY